VCRPHAPPCRLLLSARALEISGRHSASPIPPLLTPPHILLPFIEGVQVGNCGLLVLRVSKASRRASSGRSFSFASVLFWILSCRCHKQMEIASRDIYFLPRPERHLVCRSRVVQRTFATYLYLIECQSDTAIPAPAPTRIFRAGANRCSRREALPLLRRLTLCPLIAH
jgi:hypothetical protein